MIKDAPFIDDWQEQDYEVLVSCLRNTIRTGGFVQGAFDDGKLKGIVSVEPDLFGGAHNYLDLSCIHVSEDMRGRGIGEKLFEAAKEWAKEKGETQAFYHKMGCMEAQLYHEKHVADEPYDCQLECRLFRQ